MSRDQKPAKMRVIAASGQAPHPLRRAGDREPDPAPDAAAAVAAAQDGIAFPLPSLLFVASCALGGIGVAVLLRMVAA